MRIFTLLSCFYLLTSCSQTQKSHQFTSVKIQTIYEDSLSIRAIEIMGGSLAFAANKGVFGTVDLRTGRLRTNVQSHDSILPEFRAVAHTATDFFMLSIANPALLFKTGDDGNMELVYKEQDSLVFYDAMKFWNNEEGVAMGDSIGGCLSIIITRNGGRTWEKLPCPDLPDSIDGEGAFAASNATIEIVGEETWIATTSSRIFYSEDKGRTWEVFQTPIVKEKPTQGIYALDFYDENLGIAIGGDYTEPENNTANMAITVDGGRTWKLIADGREPAYKSCIQFVPNSGGEDIVALGFTGISYSKDGGVAWKSLSEESFYTFRFLNDSVAYAAGKDRIAKLIFQ